MPSSARSILRLSALVLLSTLFASPHAAASVGAPAPALQEQKETPKPVRKDAEEIERPPRGQPERAGDAKKASEKAGAEERRTAANRGQPAPAQVKRLLALEEGKHRERLAKIARLRELAVQKGQSERIAALDGLLKKENARFARVQERGRQALGSEYGKVEKELVRGRGRGAERPGGEPGKQPAGKQGATPDTPREKGKAGGQKQQAGSNPRQAGEKPRQAGGNPRRADEKPQRAGGNPRGAGEKPQRPGGKKGGGGATRKPRRPQ